MRTSGRNTGQWSRIVLSSAVAAGCVVLEGDASEPLEPLPTPYFSFDLASPTIGPTGTIFQADDILTLDPQPDPPPPPPQPRRLRVAIDGTELGMGLPGDDLDGLSAPNSGVPETITFALLVSVDRATVGQVGPDPGLASQGVPYNVQDQAARGHAAGDWFMTTALFTRNGIVPRTERLGPNTVMTINNWNEGGTDFEAEPETSANQSSSDPEDNVDSAAYVSTNGLRGVQPPPVIYFSATRNSPSLGAPGHLPGGSGADIFGHFVKEGTTTFPYAQHPRLGLQPQDDIDTMLVFDQNSPSLFEPGDQVLFSLTADSPSLQMVPGASAADIFSVVIIGNTPQVSPFARASDMGLVGGSDSADDIDAVELLFCGDAEDCARRHGIRRVGDRNHDGKVDLFDAHFFWGCFSGSWDDPNFVPPPSTCQAPFDTDLDTDVDLADWDLFRHDMTGPL